jgi:hypothetical protein
MSDTESRILDNIPDIGDVGGQVEGGGGEPQGGDASGSSNEGRTSAQPTSDGLQGGTDQRATQQDVRRRHDGLLERQSQEHPNTRDLVDPISGRIVARGGVERRIYEDSQRVARENNALKQQVQGMSNALRSSNNTIQEAARLGVTPEDQVVAMRVMADFMRDPVRTLQALVEEVKSKGYEIPFLAQGVNPGMDLRAISSMIDNKLAPILGQHQQQQQVEVARQQAQRDLEAFTNDNPESQQNLDVLAEMLQAAPNMRLNDAYTKLIRWAHENGLDWTQSLKQQIYMMRQQQQQPQQPEPRPLPGRRSATRQGVTPMNGQAQAQFNENASWADIIRSAMHDSGVQF